MATTGGVVDGTPQTLDKTNSAWPSTVGVIVTLVSVTSASWKQLPESFGLVSICVMLDVELRLVSVLLLDKVVSVELDNVLLVLKVLLLSVLNVESVEEELVRVLEDDKVESVDNVLLLEIVLLEDELTELGDSRADDRLDEVLRV